MSNFEPYASECFTRFIFTGPNNILVNLSGKTSTKKNLEHLQLNIGIMFRHVFIKENYSHRNKRDQSTDLFLR